MAHRIGRTPQIIQPSGNKPEEVRGLARTIYLDSTDIRARLIDMLPKDGSEGMSGPLPLWQTAPPLPDPATWEGSLIYNTANNVSMTSNGGRWTSSQWVFNVRDFGARGDGLTDDTDAIQAAITAAEDFAVSQLPSGLFAVWGAVYIPAGEYLITGLTVLNPINIFGDGRGHSILFLMDGSDISAITDFATFGWFSPNIYEDFAIIGNGANQTGFSAGIAITSDDTSEYRGAPYIKGLHIQGCLSDGIFVGEGRSAGLIRDTLCAFNGFGCRNGGFDWCVQHSQFGGNTGAGWIQTNAGGCQFVQTNFYINEYGVVVEDDTNSYMYFFGCSMDTNLKHGFVYDGNTQEDMSVTLSACQFTRNSGDADDTYDDIHLTDAHGFATYGCTFRHLPQLEGDPPATPKPQYTISFNGTCGPALWSNNHYQMSGTTPFATALTNDFTKLVIAGDRETQVRRNAIGDILIRPPADGQTRAKGTPTDDDAEAGDCGEFLVDANFVVPLTTATAADIAEITLTPGDWDVTASVVFTPEAATTTTQMAQSISDTTATFDFTVGGYEYVLNDPAGLTGITLLGGSTIGPRRFSVSSNTTVYLVALAAFSGGDMDVNGIIRARRVR